MRITIDANGSSYQCQLDRARSIAIPLEFDGSGPNHFVAPRATRKPLETGSFVGSTVRGGGCNVSVLTMVPHCNGTHTETVNHIVDQAVPVGQEVLSPLLIALLITVEPVAAQSTEESYRPPLNSGDRVVTGEMLGSHLAKWNKLSPQAVVIRTLPNEIAKVSQAFTAENQPPFLTIQAMDCINHSRVEHLLVDFPSIDRMFDEGLLTNHHRFWNVPERSQTLNSASHRQRTITELVHVPNDLADGYYLLNLQIPSFSDDAAPSRPILIPMIGVQ